jgi:hypothetical protein
MESSQTVVKNSEEAKKEVAAPVSDTAPSAVTAPNTTQTETAPSGITQIDVATMASSGVTAIAVASESVTQTGITASG